MGGLLGKNGCGEPLEQTFWDNSTLPRYDTSESTVGSGVEGGWPKSESHRARRSFSKSSIASAVSGPQQTAESPEMPPSPRDGPGNATPPVPPLPRKLSEGDEARAIIAAAKTALENANSSETIHTTKISVQEYIDRIIEINNDKVGDQDALIKEARQKLEQLSAMTETLQSHPKAKLRRRLADRLLHYENYYSSGADGHPRLYLH